MKWIDSHAHPHYIKDFDSIKVAIEDDVELIMCVATDLTQYEILQNYKKQYTSNVFISIGEHPCNDLSNFDCALLEKYAPEFNAIGETGFDLSGNLQQQRIIFDQHAEIAIKHHLPIILHTRNAEVETMAAIAQFPMLKGVFHCFTGSLELAQFAIEKGWMISFSGIVTFPKAQELREILKIVPLNLLLIETDAPFLAPVPMRGKSNQPAWVKHTGAFIANYLDISHDDLKRQLKVNFLELFA